MVYSGSDENRDVGNDGTRRAGNSPAFSSDRNRERIDQDHFVFFIYVLLKCFLTNERGDEARFSLDKETNLKSEGLDFSVREGKNLEESFLFSHFVSLFSSLI